MKKSLLLFFFVNFSLFAQENFLETYHPYRNKAEMAIVEGNYAVATAAYKTAFESVKNPLAKDIFNATVCKFLQNDFERVAISENNSASPEIGTKPKMFSSAKLINALGQVISDIKPASTNNEGIYFDLNANTPSGIYVVQIPGAESKRYMLQ